MVTNKEVLVLVFYLFISVCNCNDFVNADDFIKKFTENRACNYQCENGAQPVRNPKHKPSSNGCGSFGLQVSFGDNLPAFTSCCDEHDICYDTCNSDRLECDKKFSTCLKEKCEQKYKTTQQKVALLKECKQAAMLTSASASALGCTAYLEAQKKACKCDPRFKAEL